MRSIFRLSFAYLRFYKRQTGALFLGILLSAALLTGVASLFSSGKIASKENAREEYGDWHYSVRCDIPWFETFTENPVGEGFVAEAWGVEIVKKAVSEPFEIQMVWADDAYLSMMGRELIQGSYPQKENEIAMDSHTLLNLGVEEKLGSQVILDGESFVLSGILTEMPVRLGELMGNYMQVFVSKDLDYGKNGSFLYLKFDESKSVYSQLKAFVKQYGIEVSVARNNGLAGYVGGEPETVSLKEIWQGLTMPGYGLPYVWGMLNENEAMTEGAVLAALGIFSIFIIYSIFQISLLKRISQHSVMETLGMTDGNAFLMLFFQLFVIFLGAYPAGCILGNGAAAWIYERVGKIFITRNITLHTGTDLSKSASLLAVSNLPDAGSFQPDLHMAGIAAGFLFLFLGIISLVLIRKMRSLTIRQRMAKEILGGRKNRKIYSLKRRNLTGILTKRFMFSKRGTFAGILLSLSVGSVIFLGVSYVTENTKINNELTFAADDGLGSEIQVYEDSDRLGQVIPQQTAEAIKKVSAVESVLPVRYLLGEVPLRDGILLWTEFVPEIAGIEGWEPDPELMEKYNGRFVKTGQDDYAVKVNIYGYEDQMLESLEDYVLEGEIDPDQMRKENTVIFKTLMDGQGNHDGISIHPGDDVTVRTPKDLEGDGEVLKFLLPEENYDTRAFKVSAIVSRPLGKVDSFIGDDGSDSVDLIMTNEQMEKNFGVTGYYSVSISVNDKEDAGETAAEIRSLTEGIPGCVVKDYSGQIEAQNLYLSQQMMFFYGIGAVLLAISLIHILNSMQYLVAERRYEFSLLRAMGITDAGFLKMLMREGLRYGICSSLAILAVYFPVQRILYYFMVHVYLYLHPQPGISPGWIGLAAAANILLCTLAMVMSGRGIVLNRNLHLRGGSRPLGKS